MTQVSETESQTEAEPTGLVWGEVTDETIADAATMMGVELRRDRQRWVSQANYDAIQHFVEGLCDRNPLYRDREYGKNSHYGTLIAPPTFLYAVDTTVIAPKMPGVQWIYAGVYWTFYDVVKLDEWFHVKAMCERQEEKTGSLAKRWVLQTGHVWYYRDSDNALVAEAVPQHARTPRGKALRRENTNKYAGWKPWEYTADEVAAIEKHILETKPRGAEPRYWESVNIGDELRPVVKGPLTTNDMCAWYAGAMGVRPYGGAMDDSYHYRTRHDDYIISEHGTKDSPGRGHLQPNTGQDVGMGGAYDIGTQRAAWCSILATDWMGDSGFLHKFHATLKRSNMLGDTTYWRGKVVDKRVVEGYHLVELETYAENQRGWRLCDGGATVILPSEKHGDVKLPIPRDLVPEITAP